jgi:hypothetical protein
VFAALFLQSSLALLFASGSLFLALPVPVTAGLQPGITLLGVLAAELNAKAERATIKSVAIRILFI